MIKQAMSTAGLELLAVGGLLIFVAVFVGVCVWVTTRGRKEVEKWASLPMADGTNPVEPRLSITTRDTSANDDQEKSNDYKHSGGGCGKCVDCTCAPQEMVSYTSMTLN